jgi:folate-binding protein YgfZ
MEVSGMATNRVRAEIDAEPSYLAATTGAVVIDRTDRVFVRVHGRDPEKMVQGLITNDLNAASDQRALYAGLLTPKGKLLAELRAYRRGGEVLLETDRGALDNLLAHFRKFVPPLFARFEVTDQISLLGVYGPESALLIAPLLDGPLPEQVDELRTAAALAAIRTSYAGGVGFDLLIEGDAAAIRERLIDAGAQFADLTTLEVLRIEAGSPRWSAELDENVIPLEAGLRERMISQTKGCYTGQEVIIRILHRGHVNRLLRGMLLGEISPPAKGTELIDPAAGKSVGRITSACHSPQQGETIALGYARRELPLPARLHLGTIDGPAVTVVALPFEGAPAQ